MRNASDGKSSATDAEGLELIGFGAGAASTRNLSAKVGEKPIDDEKDFEKDFKDD
jgi:hypothetical protein